MAAISDIFGGGSSETFRGLAKGDIAAPRPGVALLGIPLATPYATTGDYATGSPGALREAIAKYSSPKHHYDFDFAGPMLPGDTGDGADLGAYDYGDLQVSSDDLAGNRETISSTVRALRAAGAVPVIMGGDDSIPIPVMAAYDDLAAMHILQIDAHIDWRHEVDGETQGLSSNMRRASEMGHVTGITQVGARDTGSARAPEVADAEAWGAKLFPMTHVTREGLDAVIASLPEGADLYINLDVDGLDPSEIPAVLGPAPGGLTFRETAMLLEAAAKRCRIAGFSLVEFVPANDTTGLAALTAARLVCHAIARVARQG